MFVTEEEGNDRLSDPRNVLTRVDRSDPDSPIEDFLPPDPIVDFPELSDAEPVKKSKADQDPFTALKLDRILFPNDPGRKAGIRNRTNEENASVALSSLLLGGPAAEEMFGVPQSTQSALKQGSTSTDMKAGRPRKVKEELLDAIYTQGTKVQEKAFNKLIKSLDLITDANLQTVVDPVKMIQVAKGLSGIIKDVTPKDSDGQEGGVHFHIYRPEQNEESHYEVVEVGSDGAVSVEQH